MEAYNRETQIAKINAGLKGGNQFNNLIEHPAMTVVDGFPTEAVEKYLASPTPQMTIEKSFFDRK